MAGRPRRHLEDDGWQRGDPRPGPRSEGAGRAPGRGRRRRAQAPVAARRPDPDPLPALLGRRARRRRRRPHPPPDGARAGRAPSGPRPGRADRAGTVRSVPIPVGRHPHRGPRRRSCRAVLPGGPRAHRRHGRHGAGGPAARRAEPGGRGRRRRGVGPGGRQRCRLRVGGLRSRRCPLARRLGRLTGGRPQAGHVHDEHRLHERGSPGRRRPRRGPQHRSVRHRAPQLPARPRHGQLGVEAAGGDRRAAVPPHGVALGGEPLRSGLGERRPYRGAGARRQPQRPPRGRISRRARSVPRAVGHRLPGASHRNADDPPPRG